MYSGFDPGLVSCLVTALISVKWEANKDQVLEN